MELLKLRFGENSLQLCEVMLKDIADSKRADNFIHTSLGSTTKVCFSPPSHWYYDLIMVMYAVINSWVHLVSTFLAHLST